MVLKIAGYEKNDVLHVQTKTGEEKEVLNRFHEMFFENGIIGLTKEDVEVFFRGKIETNIESFGGNMNRLWYKEV